MHDYGKIAEVIAGDVSVRDVLAPRVRRGASQRCHSIERGNFERENRLADDDDRRPVLDFVAHFVEAFSYKSDDKHDGEKGKPPQSSQT